MSNMEINHDDISKAKIEVVASAFGINSLSEDDLFTTLETLYWKGFRAGAEKIAANLEALHD
jgi:hypothetical protein